MRLFEDEVTEIIDDDIRYVLRCNPHRKEEIAHNRNGKTRLLTGTGHDAK